MKRALLIKTKNLGDSVILTSSISALSDDYLVDVYCKEDSVEIFRNCDLVNEIFFESKSDKFLKKVAKYFCILKKLSTNRYDVLVNYGDDWRGAILARLIKPSLAVARQSRKRGGFWGKSFHVLAKNPDSRRHAAEQDLDLLRAASLYSNPIAPRYNLCVDSQLVSDVKNIFSLSSQRPLIVIHAVSRWKFKEIPILIWSRLVFKLVENGYCVVLSGASSDSLVNNNIAKNVSSANVYVANNFSISQTLALYSLAKCLISVDSMSVHAASAVGIPVVGIYGPTNEDNWRPWRVPHRVVVADNQFYDYAFSCRPCGLDGCGGGKKSACLNVINEDSIYESMLALLKQDL